MNDETSGATQPWALARIEEGRDADRFPAILALRCVRCAEMRPRNRIRFVIGAGRGDGAGRVPMCQACLPTHYRRSLRIAVADRRAS